MFAKNLLFISSKLILNSVSSCNKPNMFRNILHNSYLSKFNNRNYTRIPTIERLGFGQETCLDPVEEKKLANEVIDKVNEQISKNEQGRLFAIIHVSGKQVRVTQDDIIIVDNNSFAPSNGDKIKFEKVMLVGGSDFTLIGRPLLTPGQVEIVGTIIEKDLSHTRTHQVHFRRKNKQRLNFFRSQLTMVRINKIEVNKKVGERADVEGTEQLIL